MNFFHFTKQCRPKCKVSSRILYHQKNPVLDDDEGYAP